LNFIAHIQVPGKCKHIYSTFHLTIADNQTTCQ